jgi:RimJ/RimL family protein N-acetyltransferase
VIALTVQNNTASWGLMLRLGMERRAELDFDNADFDPENPRIIAHAIARENWRKP